MILSSAIHSIEVIAKKQFVALAVPRVAIPRHHIRIIFLASLLILLHHLPMAKAQSTHEVEMGNRFGLSLGNNGPAGDPGSGTTSQTPPPETFEVAFDIQSSGKQIKHSCAVCHWLEVQIDGKRYQAGEVATLRGNQTYDITVVNTPRPLPPNAVTPPHPPEAYTARFTVYPMAVGNQTISEVSRATGSSPTPNDSPQAFIASKDEVLQYLIENTEGLLVRDKKWPENPADEPMKKKAKIHLLPVEFKKIYEENNPVNFVHDTTPKDDPPPLPRNILYTVIVPQSLDYHLKLEMEIPESFRTKFMWAVVNNQNQTAGEGFFPADGPADVVFDHNASEWRGDYDVFVGYDANSNSVLDESERTPVTVPKLNQPLKIHGANSDAYAASNIAIATGGILGGYVVPLTEALLDIFFFGGTLQVEEGWKPTSTTTVSFNCFSDEWSDWLTHNAGAGFNASGDATIKLYTWDSSTQASNKLATAPAIKDNLLGMYGLKQSQIASALENAEVGTEMSFPSATGWYEFPLNRITFEDQPLHKDEYYALARARISGFKVRFKAKKISSGVEIVETVTTGAIEDLYDFNYITPFPATEAATLQLSHGNGSFGSGREAGQIYRNRFEFYETWNGLP